MKCIGWFGLLWVLAAAAAFASGPVALTGATLYDGSGAAPVADAVVVLEGSRIRCAGSAADCPVPDDAEVHVLDGQYLTPGLVDGHVHHAQTGWLDGRPDSRIGLDHYDYDALLAEIGNDSTRWHRAWLCSGVTAVFDVGGPMWTADLDDTGAEDPERVYVRATGPLITHAGFVFDAPIRDTFLPMDSDERAVESVGRVVEAGAAAVKVWYLDPPDSQREALDARLMRIGEVARRHGLPLVVHATELANAKAALRAGAAMLVHSVDDEPVDAEFIRLARENATVYAPTLVVTGHWRRALASVALGVVLSADDPNRCIDAASKEKLADAPALRDSMDADRRDPNRLFGILEASGVQLSTMRDNLRRVHEAGIPVVTATDAGNPLTFHGPSMQQEMEAMEAAGMEPADVLVMSTRNGARIMGGEEEFGTVAADLRADLLVLAEDPGESTRAFRSITYVIRAGHMQTVADLAAQ